MKKILSLVLALALVLAASAAFADVPGNIKDIEGLPEMPEVPTMTTSVSGTTETIVVSEKLNWLNWIQNWNWNQIEWSEDGLTGTFSLAGLTSQPGYGNYANWTTETDPWWIGPDYYSYSKGDEVELNNWFATNVKDVPFEFIWDECFDDEGNPKFDNKGNLKDWTYFHEHYYETKKSYDPGFVIAFPNVVCVKEKDENWQDVKPYHWYNDVQYKKTFVEMEEEDWDAANEILAAKQAELAKQYPDLAPYIYSFGWVESYLPDGTEAISHNKEFIHFGTYDLNAKVGNAPIYSGMAFDGEAANGAHVRYDRFGRVISITSTLTGVNFLNMENEPVKTEVTWGVSKTEYGRKFYIASIKAYIDDETAVEAGFASGGKLLKVK